jgi:hypothetical protein
MWLSSREMLTEKRTFLGHCPLSAVFERRESCNMTASPRRANAYSQDFEVFMQELEEDSDLRSQIRLYKGIQTATFPISSELYVY